MRRRTLSGAGSHRLAEVLLWLMAALLFGQALGAVHRVVHATRIGTLPWTTAAGSVRLAMGVDSRQMKVAQSVLSRLFAAHGEADCVLLDQALQPSPVAVPTSLPLLSSPVSKAPFVTPAIAPASGLSAFDARGPPSLLRRTSF